MKEVKENSVNPGGAQRSKERMERIVPVATRAFDGGSAVVTETHTYL